MEANNLNLSEPKKTMKHKKIFLAIGPFITAILIVGAIYFSGGTLDLTGKEQAYLSGANLDAKVKGTYLVNQSLVDEMDVPVISSSETAIYDEMHPKLLAEKYQRPYQLHMLGARGEPLLNQYLQLVDLPRNHHDKAIFMVSLSSFIGSESLDEGAFANFYSPYKITNWLLAMDEIDASDQWLGSQLLSYKNIIKNEKLVAALKQVAEGRSLSSKEIKSLSFQQKLYERSDFLFSWLSVKVNQHLPVSSVVKKRAMFDYQYAKKNRLNSLPDTYNKEALQEVATDIGKAQYNNPFHFYQSMYQERTNAKTFPKKNSGKSIRLNNEINYQYVKMIGDKLEEKGKKPLIIVTIPSKRWLEYSGLSLTEIEKMKKKITTEMVHLREAELVFYQANNTYGNYDPYHLALNSWIEVDEIISTYILE